MIFISHNNVGWLCLLYYTHLCSFIQLRVSWAGRSKMAWLTDLTVELGCHLEHRGSLSFSGLNWPPYMVISEQGSETVKMQLAKAQSWSCTISFLSSPLVKASWKTSLNSRDGGRSSISQWKVWKSHTIRGSGHREFWLILHNVQRVVLLPNLIFSHRVIPSNGWQCELW